MCIQQSTSQKFVRKNNSHSNQPSTGWREIALGRWELINAGKTHTGLATILEELIGPKKKNMGLEGQTYN